MSIKVIFFDVGYTLVDEDAVWENRCREQAELQEAKQLGLSAQDIYHEIEKATIATATPRSAVLHWLIPVMISKYPQAI